MLLESCWTETRQTKGSAPPGSTASSSASSPSAASSGCPAQRGQMLPLSEEETVHGSDLTARRLRQAKLIKGGDRVSLPQHDHRGLHQGQSMTRCHTSSSWNPASTQLLVPSAPALCLSCQPSAMCLVWGVSWWPTPPHIHATGGTRPARPSCTSTMG